AVEKKREQGPLTNKPWSQPHIEPAGISPACSPVCVCVWWLQDRCSSPSPIPVLLQTLSCLSVRVCVCCSMLVLSGTEPLYPHGLARASVTPPSRPSLPLRSHP